MYHNYDDLTDDIKKRIKNIYTKEDYTFIIENYLRQINKLYSYDIIWIYYKL